MPPVAATSLVVEEPGELVERYYPNGKLGGLALDGELPSALGTLVVVTVRVRKPVREFSFRGVVAWARHRAARQPPSFGVEFSPADDGARDRLLAFARNEVSPEAVRLDQRLQVELAVRLVHDGEVRKEQLADLSMGGAFVRTSTPLKVGAVVKLSLRPPLSLGSFAVRGYVAWAREVGPLAGMGIEFVPDDAAHLRLERLLARLSRA